jgi:hypothetical protein
MDGLNPRLSGKCSESEGPEVMHFSGMGQLDILLANREATMDMISRAKAINNFPVPVVAAEDIVGL